jgi:putative transcriptional regulator
MSDDKDLVLDELLGTLSGALAEPEGQSNPGTHEPRLGVPDIIDVVAIRKRTGLSQPAFANSIGVPVATLRNGERGHRSPQGPARVLLALLERNPRIVKQSCLAALGGSHVHPDARVALLGRYRGHRSPRSAGRPACLCGGVFTRPIDPWQPDA